MGKKKTSKKRAENYEKNLSVNASFEDLIKLSVHKTKKDQ